MLAKKIIFTATIATAMVTVCGYALNTQAQTLEDAITQTFQNHPQVEAAKTALDITKQDVREQKSGLFPTLSANATAGRVFQDNATSRGLSVTRGDGYSYLWEGGISATQKLYDASEVSNRIKSAISSRQASQINLADVKETLSFSVVQAYINVLRARKALGLINAQRASVNDYHQRIQTMVNEGAADAGELQQALEVKAILDNFKADYIGQLSAAQADYFELTGQEAPEKLRRPVPNDNDIPDALNEALSVIEEHPVVRGIKLQSQAAGFNASAEEGTIFPKIDGELSYQKTDKRDVIGGESVDGRAVLRMNWNFDTGGAQLARIQRTKLEHQESLARVREAKNQIERGIRLAMAEFDTAKAQLAVADRRVALNKKLFQTNKDQFEGARVTLLQLMQADNQLFNSKLERINADHRLLLAKYGKLASMGRLNNAFRVTASQDLAQKNDVMTKTQQAESSGNGQE